MPINRVHSWERLISHKWWFYFFILIVPLTSRGAVHVVEGFLVGRLYKAGRDLQITTTNAFKAYLQPPKYWVEVDHGYGNKTVSIFDGYQTFNILFATTNNPNLKKHWDSLSPQQRVG